MDGHQVCSGPLRVLIVEDYVDCAESTAWLLRQHGFEVEIAPNGTEALALAAAHENDVVLLDIGLPGMNGWDVARLLKARVSYNKPFIIALSGFGTDADRRQSAEAGIDMHLTKPVDPGELEKILRGFHALLAR